MLRILQNSLDKPEYRLVDERVGTEGRKNGATQCESPRSQHQTMSTQSVDHLADRLNHNLWLIIWDHVSTLFGEALCAAR